MVAVLAAISLLVGAVPASAHDALRSTSPADGATVDRLPDRVVLTFDQPALALGSEVVVTGPAGPVSDGPPSLVDNEVRQPVRTGPAGRYTVVWRVTSADGHPVSGSFAFTTQQAGAVQRTDAAQAVAGGRRAQGGPVGVRLGGGVVGAHQDRWAGLGGASGQVFVEPASYAGPDVVLEAELHE